MELTAAIAVNFISYYNAQSRHFVN